MKTWCQLFGHRPSKMQHALRRATYTQCRHCRRVYISKSTETYVMFKATGELRPLTQCRSGYEHVIVTRTPPTTKQLRREPPRVASWEPCPCGSGRSLKRCCQMGHR